MKSAIKKGCLGFILILLLLFLNGCNTKTYTVQDVHFKRNMTIDLNSKNTPLNLISDVDGIKVDSSNIKGNKFSFKNLVIRYDTFSNKKEGSFNITFNTNDPNAKSFTKNIKVADVSKPVIHLKKKKIKFYVDEYQTIDFYKYFTYEDNSNIDDLTVMIDSNKITQNAGSYDVTIQVYDKAKNTAYAKIKVILKDRPVPKQEEQSNNKAEVKSEDNNVSGGSKKNTQNYQNSNKQPNNQSNTQHESQPQTNSSASSKVSNPSQFNKYFAGNSIDTYNEALSYAEGMMNSGKVNGYALNPDGNGFNVVFS